MAKESETLIGHMHTFKDIASILVLAWHTPNPEADSPVYYGSYRLPGGEDGEILEIRDRREGTSVIMDIGIVEDFNYKDETKSYDLFTCTFDLGNNPTEDIKVERIVADARTNEVQTREIITEDKRIEKIARMDKFLKEAKRGELRRTKERTLFEITETPQGEQIKEIIKVTDFLPPITRS